MTELQYLIKHHGLTPKQLFNISRRGWGAAILTGLGGAAFSRLASKPSVAAARDDFTLAIIPDPQYLAQLARTTQADITLH